MSETPELEIPRIGQAVRERPECPGDLIADGSGAQFWDVMVARYEFGPHELVLLASCCRIMDTITEMREEAANSPMMVYSPAQGEVVNRLYAEIKSQQSELRQTIRSLHLPDDEDGRKSKSSGVVTALRRERARGQG